ncbi:MAG: ankyrin repeat domain-containing protein [Bryobacterales bacterium]|nr:ankyrin repeat domain-containing protein [Bryobacterales bacterium]
MGSPFKDLIPDAAPGEPFLDAARAGDVAGLRSQLTAHPELIDYRNEMGQSAVLLAQYHRKPEAVRYLLSRSRVLTLHDACATGVQARVEELLIEVPRMIDSHSPDGFTPLALACFFGHVELARWLINRGANLDLAAENPMQVTPLHAASAGRHLEIVRALLEGGANPNARQQGGFTPLHAAAQSGDAEIARLLIEKGADREARAGNNQTALDLALLRGHAAAAAVIEG